MQLTKKASYGLIAAVELARAPADTPRSAAWIADRYDLPVAFIEKILHQLRQAGLVASRQGRGGGYTLPVEARRVSVRRVLEALGEGLDLVDCLGQATSCRLTGVCPTKDAWRTINDRFRELLDRISLDDLRGGTTTLDD
ncbi:MAG: Rrf2 family transcriptional regulator [Candidatus Bipolaricaulota bacterium]|nr:Rrf2 family transcriptional regulator [Candidatus Bipolaricaulota bacterium]